ncbi:hypothetical protein M405DRAFT_840548 [Rhizopogon salebrosus TDB-379]|nr:hypothetical protein M405DRAFT_840548 [Rhizopogon salebrosus TDB-379]
MSIQHPRQEKIDELRKLVYYPCQENINELRKLVYAGSLLSAAYTYHLTIPGFSCSYRFKLPDHCSTYPGPRRITDRSPADGVRLYFSPSTSAYGFSYVQSPSTMGSGRPLQLIHTNNQVPTVPLLTATPREAHKGLLIRDYDVDSTSPSRENRRVAQTCLWAVDEFGNHSVCTKYYVATLPCLQTCQASRRVAHPVLLLENCMTRDSGMGYRWSWVVAETKLWWVGSQ